MNVVLADIISNNSKLISSLGIQSDILLMRNYFVEKVQAAKKVHTINLALNGLQSLSNLPFVKVLDRKAYKF